VEFTEAHSTILRSAREMGRIALPIIYRDDETLCDLVQGGLLALVVNHDQGGNVLIFELTEASVSFPH
jgi:hypothetical protein